MFIEAVFIKSAAGAGDFPADGVPEIALVGRSNVGKSSLINALVRRPIARTSAAPGKTRLANIYRVARGASAPFYLVDLPGYGYARGFGAAREFRELTGAYFERAGRRRHQGQLLGTARGPQIAAVLLVDARHPGLDSDRAAWAWLLDAVADRAIVATKIDKLARGQRIRASRQLESVFDHPVLLVSAAAGEGMEQLWNLIDTLVSNSRNNPNRRSSPPKGMAPQAPPPATPPRVRPPTK